MNRHALGHRSSELSVPCWKGECCLLFQACGDSSAVKVEAVLVWAKEKVNSLPQVLSAAGSLGSAYTYAGHLGSVFWSLLDRPFLCCLLAWSSHPNQ